MKVVDIRKDGIDGIRKHENEEISVTGCLGERYIGVDGNVQDAAADTMNAGLLAVNGSAGDALAYGMRGGRVYIRGDAGYRAGVHMKAYEDRKSILVIGGRTGSFLGEYLAGGIIIVLNLDERKDITGYFCGNGMYAGTIYLRTQCPPVNLSDKLITRNVGKEEMESVIRPLVTDFASVFSLSAAKCLEGRFMAVEADKSKSYSQLYAAV